MMAEKQHQHTFDSPDGVDPESATFGEGVALIVLLQKAGHTSEDKAFHISREDYMQMGLAFKKLNGAIREDGNEFSFWVETLRSN